MLRLVPRFVGAVARSGGGDPPYRWEFADGGREIVVAVRARVFSTDSAVNIRLTRAGLELAIEYADQVRDEIARGSWCPYSRASASPSPDTTYSILSGGTPRRRRAR